MLNFKFLAVAVALMRPEIRNVVFFRGCESSEFDKCESKNRSWVVVDECMRVEKQVRVRSLFTLR